MEPGLFAPCIHTWIWDLGFHPPGPNKLARITAPLLAEIDRLLQATAAAALGLLLDLFSNEPSLHRLLLGNDTGDGVGWSRLADALDSIL